MAFTTFDKLMQIITLLDDEPNDVGGLTADQLKAKFDEGGLALQDYINNTLIPALEAAGVETTVQLPENDAGFKYLRLNADRVLETSTDGITWQATGSSGHIIVNASGTTLPQRSRLRFMNGTVVDNGTETLVTAMKGDTGATGPIGPQGIQGVQGPKGDLGPVIIPSIDASGMMHFAIQQTAVAPQSVSVRGPQGVQGVQGPQGQTGPVGPQGIQGTRGAQGIQGIQGETGPAGPKGETGPQGPIGPQGERGAAGEDGKSFSVKDVYATLADLNAAFPSGNEYAYQVTGENNEIFIWSSLNSAWVSLGALQGPMGPQGPAGPQGETGATGATGPQGPQGIQGVQGEQGPVGPEGPQGVQGVQGVAGESAYIGAQAAGYSGTEAAFYVDLAQVGNKVPNTRTINGKSLTQNVVLDADDVGAAEAIHTHAAGAVTSGTFDAARIPTLAASKVTTGTFAATGVKAKTGTDYTTARVRNIQASTTDLTAGSSSLASGDLYFVYE